MTDTEEMYAIKSAIDNLSDLDKAILITYADLGSMSKTGKVFCVSAATIYARIKDIREQIKKQL